MSQKTFRELLEPARKRHGYWLARMEAEICLMAFNSKRLKHHGRAISNLSKKAYNKVYDDALKEEEANK